LEIKTKQYTGESDVELDKGGIFAALNAVSKSPEGR